MTRKPANVVPLRAAAISREDARRFVGLNHRHNLPPKIVSFVIGLKDDRDNLRGVAMVSRPVARLLDDGDTAEVVRLCTDGVPNGCSLLYGACVRAARAIGYRRIITYTLHREGGASLRASGWTLDADIGVNTWDRPNRTRVDYDLFGETKPISEPKYRWVRTL